jgi:hypothetical protein
MMHYLHALRRQPWLLLPVLTPSLVPLGWRFAPARTIWVEAHGEGTVRHIAASPGGVLGVGTSSRVHRSPGEWGNSWPERVEGPAVLVGASPAATYWTDAAGELFRQKEGQRPKSVASSGSWDVTALGVNERDEPFVIAARRARKVVGGRLADVACSMPCVALSAAGDRLYVVTEGGELFVAAGGECRPVDAPAGVKHVAAFGERLAIVDRAGVAHVYAEGAWTRLPAPRFFRAGSPPRTAALAEVAMSEFALWAMDDGGRVYLLAPER